MVVTVDGGNALLIALLGSPLLVAIVTAYASVKKHRNAEPSLTPEAMAMVAQGTANQFNSDRWHMMAERVLHSLEMLRNDINDLRQSIQELPRPRRRR